MSLFEQIDAARILLELPERATLQEIKSHYRSLVQKWHPDRCMDDPAKCREMTVKIIAAYRLINDYCKNYKFSFSKKEVGRYISAEEWWFERFGHQPLWSSKPE
ncbi:MAG: J domain-containing protein [Proteobacteria bacterium]|nr:J domain-containing protein [Pseudomonadota bacterium]